MDEEILDDDYIGERTPLNPEQVEWLLAAVHKQHRKEKKEKLMFTIRALMFLLFVLYALTQLTGCVDDSQLIDAAYAEGHSAGRIWCGDGGYLKGDISFPDYEGGMSAAWWNGFEVGEAVAGCRHE